MTICFALYAGDGYLANDFCCSNLCLSFCYERGIGVLRYVNILYGDVGVSCRLSIIPELWTLLVIRFLRALASTPDLASERSAPV